MPYASTASGPSPLKMHLQRHPGQFLWCWPVISMMPPSRSCRECCATSLDGNLYVRLNLQPTRADMGAQQHKSQPGFLVGQLPAGLALMPHLSPLAEDARQVHIFIQHCLPVVDRTRNTSYLSEHQFSLNLKLRMNIYNARSSFNYHPSQHAALSVEACSCTCSY